MDIIVTNDVGFKIVLLCVSTVTKMTIPMTVIFAFLFDGNFMEADYNLFKLVDINQLSWNVDGFIMHLQHATVIETRHLSGIDCDQCSAICNVSTLIGLKTNHYDLGEYSVQLAHELRNSSLAMEKILYSTLLLCTRKSLKLRPIILG